MRDFYVRPFNTVSTHSRLKAAGSLYRRPLSIHRRFNTQPPEGGWDEIDDGVVVFGVSTHSRLKAAGIINTA